MRIRRKAAAADFLPELEKLLLGKPTFGERSGVETR
jgi:hypothetical protein